MQTFKNVLTEGDILAINALVELLAAQNGFQRENAYFLIEQEFNIAHISHLKQRDLNRALCLLADLQDVTIH